MPLRDAPLDFAEGWNRFVADAENGHLYQSFEYGHLKQRTGWEVAFLSAGDGEAIVAGAMMLHKALPGPYSIAAIPFGPSWLPGHEGALVPLFTAIAKHARRSHAVFCRVNLPCTAERMGEVREYLPRRLHRTTHVWSYWNPSRVVMLVDIGNDLDTVLMQMHSDTRKNFRRGVRLGVRVRAGDQRDIPLFARLIRAMAERKDVLAQDEGYYREVLGAYPAERCALFLAEHEGEVIGASLVASFCRTAYYIHGAFDYTRRHQHSSEALHVAMIRWAQARGCVRYDLGGTATEWPAKESDKGYGVLDFKRRLGARAVEYAPFCDLICRPFVYPIVSLVENAGLPLVLERWGGKIGLARRRLKDSRVWLTR